jgi:hypothetical protein
LPAERTSPNLSIFMTSQAVSISNDAKAMVLKELTWSPSSLKASITANTKKGRAQSYITLFSTQEMEAASVEAKTRAPLANPTKFLPSCRLNRATISKTSITCRCHCISATRLRRTNRPTGLATSIAASGTIRIALRTAMVPYLLGTGDRFNRISRAVNAVNKKACMIAINTNRTQGKD